MFQVIDLLVKPKRFNSRNGVQKFKPELYNDSGDRPIKVEKV